MELILRYVLIILLNLILFDCDNKESVTFVVE